MENCSDASQEAKSDTKPASRVELSAKQLPDSSHHCQPDAISNGVDCNGIVCSPDQAGSSPGPSQPDKEPLEMELSNQHLTPNDFVRCIDETGTPYFMRTATLQTMWSLDQFGVDESQVPDIQQEHQHVNPYYRKD